MLLPAPLPALLLAALCPALALNTCRTLDLEAARLKRIEAVRGQILSKLRLPAPPPDPEPEPAPALPEDVRALYNSTRELLRQRARHRELPDPQEYWAKELFRFPMETPGDGDAERWRPTARSLFFVFNATRLRAGLGRAELSRAELRMLRQGTQGTAQGTQGTATATGTATGTLGTEQRVELYQGFGNSSWRYLQGRSVRVTAEDEWLWFDVTDSIQQWLRSSEPVAVFRLSAHCPCEPEGGAAPALRISIEGFEQQRGDMQSIARRHRRVPHVLAMALPAERAQALHGQRARRDLGTESCGGLSVPRSRAAACAPCTSISAGTCSGSGSMSPGATWPISAEGPAPTSGAPTPTTPRFWPFTTCTTPGAQRRRAACRRAWSRCPSFTTWGARRAWSSSRGWWSAPASAADPKPPQNTPKTPQNLPKNHLKSALELPQKYPKSTSKTAPKIPHKNTKKALKLPQKYLKTTPKPAQKTPENRTETAPKIRPKTPPLDCLASAPKTAQNRPKTAQNCPKNSPKPPPKTPQNRFKQHPKTAPKYTPKLLQKHTPKTPKNHPKTTSKPPQKHTKTCTETTMKPPQKSPQNRQKNTPKPPQYCTGTAPKTPQKHPRTTLKLPQKSPQNHPKKQPKPSQICPQTPQNHPITSSKATKTAQNWPKSTPKIPQKHPKKTPKIPQNPQKSPDLPRKIPSSILQLCTINLFNF